MPKAETSCDLEDLRGIADMLASDSMTNCGSLVRLAADEIERLRAAVVEARLWIDGAPWEHQPNGARESWLAIKERLNAALHGAP